MIAPSIRGPAMADLTSFDGPRQPIRVAGAAPLLEQLAVCLPDWAARPAVEATPAAIRVERRNRGFLLQGPFQPGGACLLPDPWSATSRLAGELTAHFVSQADDLFEVHAAAVDLGGTLVLLLGDTMAGKSSLALHLAAGGQRLFTDDRLALRMSDDAPAGPEPVVAVGYGVAPKARLPLPDGCGRRFADFVLGRRIGDAREAIYLRLPPDERAAHLDEAPVGGLVAVERCDEGRSRLTAIPPAAIAQELFLRSFAPHLGARRLVARIARLVARLPAFRLAFSSSREGAALLARELGSLAPRLDPAGASRSPCRPPNRRSDGS